MYTPKHFRNENIAEVRDFISHNSFGILVSVAPHSPVGKGAGGLGSDLPIATHIPMLLDKSEDGRDILTGHVSRANPHHKLFTGSSQVLAIFLGPHAYVSSSWYSHENVPTWNYIAVHVYGTLKIIEGDRLLRQLGMLVDKYEAASSGRQTSPSAPDSNSKKVSLDTMSQSYVKKQLGGIVGFEITIEEIQAAYKLSQNRDRTDHENIISELEKRGDPASAAVAAEMKKKGKN